MNDIQMPESQISSFLVTPGRSKLDGFEKLINTLTDLQRTWTDSYCVCVCVCVRDLFKE